MFSLIITIVSIALVAALALATIFYGGNAFQQNSARADAAKVLNQGQQILGASEAFFAEHRRWPDSFQELVDAKYLKSIPVAELSPASKSLVAPAQAQSGQLWAMAAPGLPVYVLPATPPEVCAKVNALSMQVDGVYSKLVNQQLSQCFAPTSATFRTVISKHWPVPDSVATSAQTVDALPSDVADSGWVVPPGADAPAPGNAGDGAGSGGGSTKPPSAPFDATGAWSSIATTEQPLTAQMRDYGNLTAGTSGDSKTFFLRNTGTSGALAAAFQLTGDVQHFKIAAVPQKATAGGAGGDCGSSLISDVASTACTAADIAGGQYPHIKVTVTYAPRASGSHAVQLAATSPNGSSMPAPLALTGTGVFNAAGAWSSTYASLAPLTASNTDFGTLTANNGSLSRFFYVHNTGTNGSLKAAFTISGNTEHFKFTAAPTRTSTSSSAASCGATLPPDALSTTECTADDVSTANSRSQVRIQVKYAPTAVGSHSVTITPASSNGSAMPAPIVVTGTGALNGASGTWSNAYNTTATPAASFPDLAVGSTTIHNIYLRNTAPSGAIGSSFELTGDTEHFEISSVTKITDSGTPSACGATVSGDKTSTTACTADASGYKHIKVAVMYAPKESGTHTISLVARSNNGAVMPEPLVKTGSSPFNAVGEWSRPSSGQLTVTSALTTAETDFGALAANSSVLTKTFYLRNAGTWGRLSAAFQLSGDTAHFKLAQKPISVHYQSLGATQDCVPDAALAAGSLSSSACTAPGDPATGAAYRHLRVDVTYAPTAIGSHSVTLTPVAGNASVMPGPLTLTGTAGTFNVSGEWSTDHYQTVAPTPAWLSYKASVGQTLTRAYNLRRSGSYGALNAAFKLTGDIGHFRIVSPLYKVTQGTAGSYASASCGAAISEDGSSASSCSADDPVSGQHVNMRLTVQYAPKAPGTHTVTLTPTSENGSGMPPPLVLTGTAPFDATGAWSTTYASTTSPAAADRTFGTTSVGVGRYKTLFLRNTGSWGPTIAGFRLTGPDAEHFALYAESSKMTTSGQAATCGSTRSNDLLTTVNNCAPDDPQVGTYNHISVGLRYLPKTVGSHSVQLEAVSSNGATMPLPLALTGTASFDATGAWSTTSNVTTAYTPSSSSFGSMTVSGASSTSATRTVFLRNTGSYGPLSAAFTLTGDTSQFRVAAVPQTSAPDGTLADCSPAATLGQDKLTTGFCLAQNPQNGSNRHVQLQITYAPNAVGNHAVTVTPTSNNGSVMPAPLVLSGSGVEPNAAGAWSSASASTTWASGYEAFAPITVGQNLQKVIYMRNEGTNGALAPSFRLTGDTAHFTLTQVYRADASSGSSQQCGSTLAADALSSTTCTANDPASGTLTSVRVIVTYTPQAHGNHSVTLTPTSTNGSLMPAPLVLTGSAPFDATGVWSGSNASNTAPRTDVGNVTVNGNSTFSVYLRNTGTTGRLSAAFALTGPDASQFRITGSPSLYGSGSSSQTCSSTRSADMLSVTECAANDPKIGTYTHISVTLAYVPTQAGTHTVQLNATSSNGSTLPAPLTITGNAVFNPTGAWSSAYASTTALTGADTNLGTVATNSSVAKVLYLRNAGTHGSLSAAFALSGSSAFYLDAVPVVITSSGGTTACSPAATLGTGNFSSSQCKAYDPANSTYTHLKVTVRFAPKASGTHTATLTSTSSNGSAVPEPLVLTGSSP